MAHVAFRLSELDELLKNKDSGVTLVPKCVKKLVLSPFQLQDLKRCIKEYLYSTVAKYDTELDAIVLSYKRIKIADFFSVQDDGYNKLSYNADIYVFKPKIGSILTGIINKKSDDHLGCLVHKAFNIAIPRPGNKDESTWIGTQLKIGQEVQFKVVEVDLNEDMPYIKGELLNHVGFISNNISNESYSNDECEERICNSEEPNDKFHNNISNNNEKDKRLSKQRRNSLTIHTNSKISVKGEHFEKKSSPKKKEKNTSENDINVNNNNLNNSPNKYNKQSKLISNTLNDMYITMSKRKSEKNSKEDILNNSSNISNSKSKKTKNENHVKKLFDNKNNNDGEVFESKIKKKHKKKRDSSADVSLNNSKNYEETGFESNFQNDILSTSINDSSATESNRTKKKKNHDLANENKIQKQTENGNGNNYKSDNLLIFQENFKYDKKKQKIKNKHLEHETKHKNHFKDIDNFSNINYLKQKSKSCTDIEDFDDNLSINNEKFTSSKRNKNKHSKRNYYSLTDTEFTINDDEFIRKSKKKHKNDRKENNFNDTIAEFSDCEHLRNKYSKRNYHSLTDIESFTNEDEFMRRKKKKKNRDKKQVDLNSISSSVLNDNSSFTYSDGEYLGIKKRSKESYNSLTDVEYCRIDDSDFKRKKKNKDKICIKSNISDRLTDSLTDTEYVKSHKKKKSKRYEISSNDYIDMDTTKQKLLKMAIQQNKLNFNNYDECIIKKPESNTRTVDKTSDIKFDKKKKKSKHKSKSFDDTFQLNCMNENETDNVKKKTNTQNGILDNTYAELKAEKKRKRRFSETNLEELDNSSFSKKKKKKMKDDEEYYSFVDFDKLYNENQMETNLRINNSVSDNEINPNKKSKKKKKKENSKYE